jgi:DHA2 family multidrug resistance protein-like MFS transporter
VVRDSIDEALLAAESLPAHAAEILVALARQAFDQAFGVVLMLALGLSLLAAGAVAVLNRPAARSAVTAAS